MKNILILIIHFSFCSVYSQTDSILLKNYEKKILEINQLRNDLQTEKQNYSAIILAFRVDSLAKQNTIEDLQNVIKKLRDEVISEKGKVADLNKNKIKAERDNLQLKVDTLNRLVSNKNLIISDKENQIANEKANTKTTSEKSKNDGKQEALSSIAKNYTNQSYDEIIKSSTKESVARDMKLMANNPDAILILNDLKIYFNAQVIISNKFDETNNTLALTQLNQINQQSNLLNSLKENIEFYKNFNSALRETIGKIINKDNKLASGAPEIQKLKFEEINVLLTEYMYNYYDYIKYPYLTDVVLEILKRKKVNADAPLSDLLLKL